jgi:serine/threonine protein kinase
MSNLADCPDVELYQRLAAGEVPSPQQEALRAHLTNCPACLDRIEALPALVRQLGTLPLRGDSPGGADPYATAYPPALLAPTCRLDDVPPEPARPAQELLAFLAPPVEADELGRLGPFRILKVLGTGGMGVVFRAEDAHLQRPVALKTMLPSLAGSAEAKQRFLREARAAAALKDDRIVTIYQVGEDRGVPYLAMELLEGESLEARLERLGKLPLAEVLYLGREAALALHAAHERGLIHRDIKPANMFLESTGRGAAAKELGGAGTPSAGVVRLKILDFGLAWAKQQDGRLTQKGMIIGTPAYMAPEQTQGLEVDFRCDLFSLGCVLYQAATGQRPFDRNDIVSTLLAVAKDTPLAPHELNAQLPVPFSDLVMRLLAKDPAQRVASASALARALTHLADAAATLPAEPARPSAPPAGPPPRPRRLLAQASWLENVRAAYADLVPARSRELPDEELVDLLLEAHGLPAPSRGAAKENLSRDLALHAVRNPASECALPALFKLLKAKGDSYQRLARECLRQVGPTEAQAADILIGKLQEPHKEVRAWAIACLEQIGPTTHASVPLLIQALADEEETIRSWAVASLHQLGPSAAPAVERLLSAMKGSPPEIRVQMIDALGAIGGNAALIVPRLLQALKHKAPAVRAHAALALRHFAPAAADFLPALHVAAQDADELVRRSALSTLQEIRREENAEASRAKTPSLAATCKCGKRLRFPPAFAGKRVQCPNCGRRAVLPEPCSQ